MEWIKKVIDYVNKCTGCTTFTEKKTKKPLKPDRIPEKWWEMAAVDLFGPIPSTRHVVVL